MKFLSYMLGKFYSAVIFVFALGICVANCFFITWWHSVLFAIGTVVVIIAAHGIGSSVIYAMRKLINPHRRYFRVSKHEKRMWEILGVRAFKDLLPDGGQLVGFAKNKIADPNDPAYVKKYIHESCIGEVGHIFGTLLAAATPALFLPFGGKYWLTFGISGVILSCILGFMPIMALRYNRYKLVILQTRLERVGARKKEEQL